MSDGMQTWLLISSITVGIVVLASFLEKLSSAIIADNKKRATKQQNACGGPEKKRISGKHTKI